MMRFHFSILCSLCLLALTSCERQASLPPAFTCEGREFQQINKIKNPEEAEDYVCSQKRLLDDKKISGRDFFSDTVLQIKARAPERTDLIFYVYHQNDPSDISNLDFQYGVLKLADFYNKKTPYYAPKKSYDLYFLYFLERTLNLYQKPTECRKEIDILRSTEIFYKYKDKALHDLKKLCDSKSELLIKHGDKFYKKTYNPYINQVFSMYFYYTAYLSFSNKIVSLMETNYTQPDYDQLITKQKESYLKFKIIRSNLSNGFPELVKDSRFE